MKVIDFSRSFLTFRIDMLKKPPATYSHEPPYSLNSPRIQIDCRLQIVEKASGRSEQFFLGVNCKTERVGVDRDVWTDPNADFVPILSKSQILVIKTYDRVGRSVPLFHANGGHQPERHVLRVEEAFDGLTFDLVKCEAETLQTPKQIVESTLENHRLTASTTIETDRYRAVLDYPIKTMNANERDDIYQTDTGPVMLPDLDRDWEEMIEGMELAFSAFNCPDWIEFIVRQPTAIGNGESVWHYSQSKRYDVKNQVHRLDESRTGQPVRLEGAVSNS